ncbi:hypothetical protein PHMEG_0008597 [Phytophthora megakarya]|uniref:Uncharacterized protein n=1 Tax=Phytophthora megakarya TaxID=4795 RepID=A0A225WKC9_9STRA|nr:hypothetical protein PHMEG_0008597 [Phytophthora megakarya]
MKCDEHNKRLLNSMKGGGASKMVMEGLDPYQRMYICTHGWKACTSRGSNSRPRQHIGPTNCPFRFTVQWNLERMELQIKSGIYKHNDPISSEAYATYLISRGVADLLVNARMQEMLAVGAKRSKIHDNLLKHDQNVIQVDVDNMVRSHNSSVSSADDDDATAREIAAFPAADPENGLRRHRD